MLSVTIITLNEEKNLRACLESVAFAEEIIIVDNGSTDSTLDIARELTDKVFQESWKGYTGQKTWLRTRLKVPGF